MSRNLLRTRKASQVEEKIEPSHGIGKIQGISGMRYRPVWLGENFVWSIGMEDQAEEGELRTRPWKVLYASLSWLEMKNHWRFLSRTVVRLKVCQWKINLAALLCTHSY